MIKPFDESILNKQGIAASEERFRALVTATSDIIYSMSPDWRIMRQLDGRGFLLDTHEPITGWLSKYIHPQDQEKVTAAIDEAIQAKKIFQLEHRVLQANGTLGWTFSRAVPILDNNGEINEWFGAASDITDRKRAEDALREAKERSEQQKRVYETITSGTPDLIYVFDLDYRFTYANGALLSMWGKTWDNAVGKGLLENGYEPWHAEMHEREIDQVKTTKQPIRGEVSFPHATLGKRIYDYIFTPVLNAHGEVEAVAGITRDITDIRNAETAISDSEARFRTLVQQAPVAIFILSGREQRIEAMNERMFRMLGRGPEVIGKTYMEAMPEFEGQPFFQLIDDVFTSGKSYYGNEIPARIEHNGQIQEGYYNFIYEPIKDDKGTTNSVMCVAIDVTEQVKSRKEIEQAKESLQMAIDAAELGSYYINTTDRIFHPSARLKEFFGFEPDEEVPYEAAINQIHEDYRQAAADLVEAAITKGVRFDMEYPVVGFHDGKIRWVRGIGEVQHLDGKSYFTGVLHEITEKKQDEMRKNDFISMVSHELKTPLTSAIGYIQVLQKRALTDEDTLAAGMLERTSIQLAKMTSMINGFLNVSRLESGKIHMDRYRFDMALLIKEAEAEAVAAITSHQVIFKPADETLVVADREKIGQVISNLISNAVKYSPAGSTIQVVCVTVNGQVQVSVADEGIGISKEDLPRLFERYYRVKDNETRHIAGFGIGLYLCSEITKGHSGGIWAESTPGNGSTFYFTLPVAGLQQTEA